jgi:hypothetical protein
MAGSVSAVQEFLRWVARELGGRERKCGQMIALHLPDRQIDIDLLVDSQGQPSRNHLEFVEQKAAVALLAPPTIFGAKILGRVSPARRRTILRVAFGFRLVAGPPCLRRYTSYFDLAQSQPWTIRGDDALFAAEGPVETPPDTSLIARSLDTPATEISAASYDYLRDPDTALALRELTEHFKSELVELDLLYRRRSQRHVRSYGIDPDSPESAVFDSPSKEFERKKAIVHERHAVRGGMQVLSIGTISTPLAMAKGRVRLPFLKGVAEDRWVIRGD